MLTNSFFSIVHLQVTVVQKNDSVVLLSKAVTLVKENRFYLEDVKSSCQLTWNSSKHADGRCRAVPYTSTVPPFGYSNERPDGAAELGAWEIAYTTLLNFTLKGVKKMGSFEISEYQQTIA